MFLILYIYESGLYIKYIACSYNTLVCGFVAIAVVRIQHCASTVTDYYNASIRDCSDFGFCWNLYFQDVFTVGRLSIVESNKMVLIVKIWKK